MGGHSVGNTYYKGVVQERIDAAKNYPSVTAPTLSESMVANDQMRDAALLMILSSSMDNF